MTLRTQLLLVSLLTLALPWAGCQYVREMESALRHGQEESLLGSARALAGVLHERPELLYRDTELYADSAGAGDIYAHRLSAPITLDGYVDDWGLVPAALRDLSSAARAGEVSEARYVAGIDERYLYIFVSMRDRTIIYEAPGAAAGSRADRLQLSFCDDSGMRRDYVFSTSAPGMLRAYRTSADGRRLPDAPEPRIQAEWQETSTGYHLEIRLPRSMIGTRIGLAVIDVDDRTGRRPTRTVATFSGNERADLGLLIYPSPALGAALADLERPGVRYRVTDLRGWLLAEAGAVSTPNSDDPSGSHSPRNRGLLVGLYLTILASRDSDGSQIQSEPARLAGPNVKAALEGRATAHWYRAEDSGKAILSAAYPIRSADRVIGVALLEQTSDAILTLTNHALTRLLNFTLLATVLAALGMLGFATVLSIRIRRLRNAAENALGPEGRIASTFPGTHSGDELGDLSRSFATLLARLREYTQYLQSLADKLSHELRTPLAVVRTSLDNLDHEALDDAARTYADRAREGTERLSAILTAMSAATRAEQSIRTAEPEALDLGELLSGNIAAYRDVYPNRRFALERPEGALRFTGVPDLLVQMLDKLIDNAVDFSPADGLISATLAVEPSHYHLCVRNEGEPLPDKMQSQLFESMVSVRDGRPEAPHLGLGLFIVRLIAEFHGANVTAQNLRDGSGAEFCVHLPRRES